jgi:hypothetical protein
LKLARRVVIGMDCWSKKSLTASFLGISASFFHPSSHRPMHVLLNLHQIGHPHTGDMLADKLVETLKSWGISKTKVLLVVTDNGSNMLKAIRVANEIQQLSDTEKNIEGDSDTEDEDEHEIEMDDDDGEEESNEEDGDVDIDECLEEACHLHRFPCIAHTLQLVIKELSKSQTYCNLIVKVRSLVKFVKVSSVAQEKLIALCGKVVVKDCATRWNSVLLVLDRLLSIRIHLEIVLKELKHDSLTNTEWERVADLQRLLAPFREQTDALQTDALSLSSVLPSILELTLHLQDQSLPRAHANMLLQSLRKRFSLFLDPSASNFDPLPAAACYLDPTVSSALMSEDLQPLLAAAKLYIKSKVNITALTSKHPRSKIK